MKRFLMITGIVVALLVVVLAAVPFMVDPNRFRPMLEAKLSDAMARQVQLGDLKLSILRGSVTASDLSIADDPAYSKAPFIKAQSLAIGVELWPLIASRKLHVTGLTIEQPQIALIQSPDGEWNFSSLGGKQKPRPARTAPEPTPGEKQDLDLSVNLIRITGSELSLGMTGARARPLVLRDVNIEVKDFSAASEFPFTLKAKVAGGGSIALDGKAGPINAADTAASPLSATLKIDSLDLAGTGIAQHAPALAGIFSITGSVRGDGTVAHIQGQVKAEKLRLAREGTPATRPVEFDFALDHNLRRRSGRLSRGDIRIGSAPAALTGTYAPQGDSYSLNMTLDAGKMAVDELSAMLPAMDVVLPHGSSLRGGTASAKLSVEGPVDRLVTAGTLSLDNTTLANFDMGRKLSFIAALAGIKTSSDTAIQTLGAKVQYGPDGGHVDNLQLIVPSIGNLDGAGTVSTSNDLAFQMRATVQSMTVPFTIQGPATDPAFRPDVKGMAKQELNTLTGPEGVKGLLKGILGGKKQQ
ncbi:MAG: AsmA family protein [Acidobacteria bacterium]|nr:AsmA family protein [Acidobacteriota bacterium]